MSKVTDYSKYGDVVVMYGHREEANNFFVKIQLIFFLSDPEASFLFSSVEEKIVEEILFLNIEKLI